MAGDNDDEEIISYSSLGGCFVVSRFSSRMVLSLVCAALLLYLYVIHFYVSSSEAVRVRALCCRYCTATHSGGRAPGPARATRVS